MRKILFVGMLVIGTFTAFCQQDFESTYQLGAKYYTEKNYSAAAVAFEKAIVMAEKKNLVDSSLYFFTGYSFYASQSYSKAIVYFDKAILFNYERENSIYYKSDCYKLMTDYENAEQSLKIGVSLYPKSEILLTSLVNIYLAQKKNDEALKLIDILISRNYQNASLFFAKGAIYESLDNRDLAYENYLKAINIDNNHFDSHFNLAAYYYNQGVEIYTAANNLPASESQKYENELVKGNLFFRKALPFFENCYRIRSNQNSSDEAINAGLKNVYYRLKSDEKTQALTNGTLLNKIGKNVIIPEKEMVIAMTTLAQDKTGPAITLINPVISRGFVKVIPQSSIVIKGKITDESGILMVSLNGAKVAIQPDGTFAHTLLLTNGTNSVVIRALDIHNNLSEYQFSIDNKKPAENLATAENPRKVALVIGNSTYKDSPLKNAVNDAVIMGKTLRDLGFEVTQLVNVTNVQLKSAVSKFGSELEKDKNTVGLFYYAGHGLQVKGKNYLVPIDAQIEREPDVPVYSFDLDGLLANIEFGGNAMNIIILDACRNNPFARSFRSLNTAGLATINAGIGTFIAFATAPGSTASDGTGENGLYTQELVKAIQIPNIPIESVFKKVRTQVKTASNGLQIPWENSSLEGDFYFKK